MPKKPSIVGGRYTGERSPANVATLLHDPGWAHSRLSETSVASRRNIKDRSVDRHSDGHEELHAKQISQVVD